ncbi:protein YhgF [Rubritalea halochordaticola]|uniref:Protein YhgF n=1 Tax=Rubritalea halochordaticola TaxID=714537 RepID=A0ABP9V464_9BACT
MSDTPNPLDFVGRIAAELKLRDAQVASTAKLLAEGATVPFIARYRKEATGSMDEVAITTIRDRMQQLGELERRRQAIVKSLEERKLLTPELKKKVAEADTMTRLEDVFAPFRPKRRTRATMAKDKGLEPLANFIWDNRDNGSTDLDTEAAKFIVESDDKEVAVPTSEEALAGARDIIAERIADDAECRAELRTLIEDTGIITSKVLMSKQEDPAAQKFKDYFDWSESLRDVPSHRLLAMRRGEKEGFLFMRISADQDSAIEILRSRFGGTRGVAADQLELALTDAYKRLLSLSLETEFRMSTKKDADAEAVRVFADNLRELLLASPLGQKRTIAIDPGFRTGCKTVVLDAQGTLQFDAVLHLTTSASQARESGMILKKMVEHYKTEVIAIGNGTASREAEAAVRAAGLPGSIPIVVVNESGASIYSASEVAREEFPDKDVTVRGAVSIGRRLMDPLSELVKIDPKSIGVGQYQHDVDQNMLKNSLDDTVISCVNGVGVEVNTASRQLLSYVSGLNSTIATNILEYRKLHGPFKSREELKQVPRFGDKTFEQAAGFLRIQGAENPLDQSAVHPERYALVEKMAADLGCSLEDLIKSSDLRKKIKLNDYVTPEVGLPTLKDILDELAKPGRDPRAKFEVFTFAEGIEKPSDLEIGMKLPGIVTNVTNFGAFVDVGVHQDGLVHISQLADKFVDDPNEVVKVGQKVNVTVTEVDLSRNRIALSMKSNPETSSRGGGGGGGRRDSGGGRPQSRDRRPRQQNQQFGGNWFDNALQNGKR